MKRTFIRRGWAVAGLALIAAAGPLIVLLGAMATAVSTAGAVVLTYALFPSGYPLLGTIGSFALAAGALYMASLGLN